MCMITTIYGIVDDILEIRTKNVQLKGVHEDIFTYN